MRSLDFNVSATEVTPKFAEIGNAGEHNVTQLKFKISQEILSTVEYYRISIGNFRSQRLYPENAVVSYNLPQSVLQAGTVLLQLDGYKQDGEEVSLIFKSGLISAEIGESVCTSTDIPEELEEPFENAVSELDSLVAEGNEILGEVARNSESAAESQSLAQKSLEETKLLHEEVKSAKENVEQMKQAVEVAASMSATSEKNAQDYAITASLESHRAETLANDTEAYAETTRNLCAEAATSAQSATSSAEQAEIHKNGALTAATNATESADNAAASALAAANNAEKLVTFIDKELPICTKLLEGGAEDWRSCSVTDEHLPYIDGAAIFFNGEIRKGQKIKCRVEISAEGPSELAIQWGPKARLWLEDTKNMNNTNYVYIELEYNSETGYFEGEYITQKATLEEIPLILAVEYPVWGVINSSSEYKDTNAVYGKIEIIAEENMHNILEGQNQKISAIGDNIESALDSIINIQNNLLGGGV